MENSEITERLIRVEEGQKNLDKNLGKIVDALDRVVVAVQGFERLEEKHNNTADSMRRMHEKEERTASKVDEFQKVVAEKFNEAQKAISEIEKNIPENLSKRLSLIEAELPTLKLSSSWVFKAMIGLVSLESIGMVVAIITFLVKK